MSWSTVGRENPADCSRLPQSATCADGDVWIDCPPCHAAPSGQQNGQAVEIKEEVVGGVEEEEDPDGGERDRRFCEG